MANAYGVKFNDWVLVAAVGGVLYWLWKSFGQGVGKAADAYGTTVQNVGGDISTVSDAFSNMTASWLRAFENKGNSSMTNNYFQNDSTLSPAQKEAQTKKIKTDFPNVAINPIGVPNGTYTNVATPTTMTQLGAYLSSYNIVGNQAASKTISPTTISTKTETRSTASGSVGTATYIKSSTFGTSNSVGVIKPKTITVTSKALKGGSKSY
jgi:hypothetical protein